MYEERVCVVFFVCARTRDKDMSQSWTIEHRMSTASLPCSFLGPVAALGFTVYCSGFRVFVLFRHPV